MFFFPTYLDIPWQCKTLKSSTELSSFCKLEVLNFMMLRISHYIKMLKQFAIAVAIIPKAGILIIAKLVNRDLAKQTFLMVTVEAIIALNSM